MKGILEFDLNEEYKDHLRAVKSTDLALALWEIVYNTKKGIGYQLEGKNMKGEEVSNYEVLEIVFDRIHEILRERNIDLDELIE